MALVESINVKLGTKMPSFTLKDPFGKTFSGGNVSGKKGLLVTFTCNHCPYALAVWPRLIELSKYAKGLEIETVGINPNIHPDYPEDAPDQMIQKIKEWHIPFPYLVDETQDVARRFQAQCTPDLYLYDSSRELVYHGRLDDNWKDAKKVTREELKEAIDCLISDQPISEKQHPSMGCSIKWRE